MSKSSDIRVRATRLYFLPVRTRVPLKFGPETLTSVTCARAWVRVESRSGATAEGWGETPLSVQWVWPSTSSYEARHECLKRFCIELAEAWAGFADSGHPIELGQDFQDQILPRLAAGFQRRPGLPVEPLPRLAALVCCSPFDLAVHDAYGHLHSCPVYQTYSADHLNRDLGDFLQPAGDHPAAFKDRFPRDFLRAAPVTRLPVWHLVGGLDPLDESELDGSEPGDGHPVLLADWIRRDGLRCLKVKLRGTDAEWDYRRLVKAGTLGSRHGVESLSADFNCTVTDPGYVNEVLDRLRTEHPRLFDLILYVEQPFPYDLERHWMDVHSVASRKPLFLDESAHDWRLVKLGRELGWNGVALKTCKTQTGALLSACWAKAHGMPLMVQDLTNPMLALIPHVLLAAHLETLRGVECNAMQFYPDASAPEAAVHAGLYARRAGELDLASIRGPGFGYRLGEIRRELPAVAAEFGC
jgi:L-alanine-DL-glutamate epimerase-like enolase superfamily enzyme